MVHALPRARTLEGGLWNCRHGRPTPNVVAAVSRILRVHDLDFLLLTETGDYFHALHRVPGARVVGFDGKPGQKDTAILVADGVPVTGLDCVKMTRRGWITVRGGHTPPKWAPTAVLAGWLRVAVMHRPPSVRCHGRFPSGPIRRVAAVIAHARSEARFYRRNHRPLVAAGDWNASPHERGRFSPAWVAHHTGLQLAPPDHGTHGRRIIDYPITRGVDIAVHTSPDKHGSDHHLVLFEVKESTR